MKKLNFINPFEQIAGTQALFIGLGGMLIASVIGSIGNIHFDGVLDIHFNKTVPLWLYIAQNFISWICTALFLSISSALLTKSSFRLIDIWGTLAFARVLLIPVAIYGALFSQQEVSEALINSFTSSESPSSISLLKWVSFGIYLFLSIITIILLALWMYKAYSVSANINGLKAIISFFVCILLAEVTAKLIIYFLSRTL